VVLELLDPEVTWSADARWFEGLLAVASEHARHHLALGRRFFTMLVVDDEFERASIRVKRTSRPAGLGPPPLIGKAIDGVTVPYPVKMPDVSPDPA
jgi:hypothetical protein